MGHNVALASKRARARPKIQVCNRCQKYKRFTGLVCHSCLEASLQIEESIKPRREAIFPKTSCNLPLPAKITPRGKPKLVNRIFYRLDRLGPYLLIASWIGIAFAKLR